MTRAQRLRVEYVAVLSLGSNLGDREATIRAAVREIAALPGVVALRASGLVETPALRPDGIDPTAPNYLNAVMTVRSALDPVALLAALNGIEREHGRVRSTRWGDRTLDIDVVSCGALRVNSPELTVPHERAAERAFVLLPWLQIDPDAQLPGHGPVRDLVAALDQPLSHYPAEPLL
jgi:2-amino-4-hydroxy-6-hydroxymethyldihydropteridine diphosphokinase